MICRKLNILLNILLLICVENVGFSQQKTPVCSFFPFKNRSDFDNKNWDIANDLPGIFADSLIKLGRHHLIDTAKFDAYLKENKIRSYQYEKEELLAKITEDLNIDYLVGGQINEFGLSRINVGSFLVGGYESYKAKMKISFFVYDHVNHRKTENYTCSSEVNKKDLGLALIGKPSEHYVSFQELDKMKFNSYEFNKTIMGEALKQLTEEFVTKFIELIPGYVVETVKDTSISFDNYLEARIVFKREEDVYINAGRAEKVSEGDILSVYTKGEPITDPDSGQVLGYADKFIGKIKVMIVKDNHLSLAKIVEQIEPFEVKDSVRIWKR